MLIVEDDADLGQLLVQYLEMNGFGAYRVFNGEEARYELQLNAYDIVVMDVMMPREDGFTLAAKITALYPALPFLFVTARKMKADILKGLQLGADDYILKPFDADELILRIRNILKRTRAEEARVPEMLQLGHFTFYPSELRLCSAEGLRMLTEKEAALLHFLCVHQGQLIKRTVILQHLWTQADFFNGRSMDVFISRLRKYLSSDPALQIESIRGVGFRFIQN